MAEMPKLIEDYLAGPALVRQAVAGMSREQLMARPFSTPQWSTLEVVCHLADFEPIYSDRMKRVLAEERPEMLAADEVRFAASLAYHDRDLEEELVIIERTRQQMARILRTLPASVLKRVGVHSEAGLMSLELLLQTITKHIPHHVELIAKKRRALGLPV